MNEKLTKEQESFFEGLKAFILENNYVPTIRELGRYVHLNSPATVKYHLDNLESKGYIKRVNNRKIEILK